VHRTALLLSAIGLAMGAGCASATSSTLTTPPSSDVAGTSPVVSGSAGPDLPASPSTSGSPTSPSPSTTVRDSTQLNGVIASGTQLVISYVGGACDVSARGSAAESAASIVVHIHVTDSGGVCPAVGYIRSVTVQLNSPWNHRAIVDDTGAALPTVDGALLLQPSWLPAGYEADRVSAGESGDGSANAVAVTDYAAPTASASPSGQPQCQPGPGDVELEQGYGITAPYPPLPGAHALADGTPVTLDSDPQGLVGLYWTPPNRPAGWSVGLQASTRCQGDVPVPLATLMQIANGLH
jgi:hypothetical protein